MLDTAFNLWLSYGIFMMSGFRFPANVPAFLIFFFTLAKLSALTLLLYQVIHAGCFSKSVLIRNSRQLSYKEILNMGTVSDR